MPDKIDRIGEVVRHGVLLLARVAPIPSPALVSAIGAAVISKIIDLHQRRVSEILSIELSLGHVSAIEPDSEALLAFFAENPIYPELAAQFHNEIRAGDFDYLRSFYPYIYGILILKRRLPALLFHAELEQKQYRKAAEKYAVLSKGYDSIQGDSEVENLINHVGSDLFEVINEAYEAVKDELRNKENQFVFEVIDYIREVATL